MSLDARLTGRQNGFMRGLILGILILFAGSAPADELPRLPDDALLNRLAKRIDSSARVVEVVVRPPKGTWRPSPLRRRGVALLVGEGERRALITALVLLEDASAVELIGAAGARIPLKKGRASREHGLAELVPSGKSILASLVPFTGVPLGERGDEMIQTRQVFLRDRWVAAADTTAALRKPVISSSLFGRGQGAEGYFNRVGVVPSPGEPIVDSEARLIAVGKGASSLEKGAVGLAIPWRFVQLYLREVLKWPVPDPKQDSEP